MYKQLMTLLTGLMIWASSAIAEPISKDDSVLVIGATGRTGQLIFNQLNDRGIKAIAGVRNVEKAKELFGENVAVAKLDLSDLDSLNKAMKGVGGVVNAASVNARSADEELTKQIEYIGNSHIASAAKNNDVKKIVLVSSMGVTQPDHFLNKFANNVLIWKYEGEKALKESGVDTTIVRPGGLQDKAGGTKAIKFMQGDKKGATGAIPRADVATVCVESLLLASASNKTFEIVLGAGDPTTDFDAAFNQLN